MAGDRRKFGFRDSRGRFILTKRRAWVILTLSYLVIACMFMFIVSQVTVEGDIRAPVVLDVLLAITLVAWLVSLVKVRHL